MGSGRSSSAHRRGAGLIVVASTVVAGPLLSPVLAELGLDHEVTGPGAATVRHGEIEFRILQRMERHLLMRIEVAEFRVPLTVRGGPGEITLGRRGRPGHLSAVARATSSDPALTAMADRLTADEALVSSFLPLDAKKLVLEVGPDGSFGVIRNVGLSRVVMAIPPTRRYVAAGPDQIALLLTTIEHLARFR